MNDPTIVVNPRQIFDEEEPEEVEERAVEKKNNNGKGKQILEKLKNPKVLAGVVAGWVRSLQLRAVELPDAIKDEVFLIVGERRSDGHKRNE